MSKTKSGGKTRQHSTRAGKRLGVKTFGGHTVHTGTILVRQRGTKYHPGIGTGLGRDHTIFATQPGTVTFTTRLSRTYISVI